MQVTEIKTTYEKLIEILNKNNLNSYEYPSEEQCDYLLTEVKEIPEEKAIVAIIVTEPFENYRLITCYLNFDNIPKFDFNMQWLDIINQANFFLPLPCLYISDNGIHMKYSFPIGNLDLSQDIDNVITTIMLFQNQVEKVFDLVHIKLQQIDFNKEPEGIMESIVNWNNEWNFDSSDERTSE
jgi:hypothetical protein